MKDVATQYHVQIVGVVTDNASNMQKMRETIHSLMPEVISFGCQAHVLNLLSNDLHKEKESIFAKIIDILKWFRNSHAAHAALKEKGIPLPPIPSEVRWSTCCQTLTYFNSNWSDLVTICASLQYPNSPIRQGLENVMVRRASEEMLLQQEPVAQAVARAQTDGHSIADMVEIWPDLLESFPRQFGNFSKAEERSKPCLNEPFCLAAHLLHHKYNGKRLTPQKLKKARDYLEETVPKQIVARFIAKSDPFLPEEFEVDVSLKSFRCFSLSRAD